MILKFNFSKLCLFILTGLILGCAGSSTDKVVKDSLYDTSSVKTSELKLITVDGATLQLSNISGKFIRALGVGSVVIPDNSETGEKTISGLIPSNSTTNFVTIIPEGNAFDESFGLIGLNSSEQLDVGSYNYVGKAEVFINDGSALYGLNGESNISISLGANSSTITGEITSLSGKKSFLDLTCRDCPASAVVDIVFPSGSLCNGNRICFNSIELKNNNLDVNLSNGYKLDSDGALFGANASELGTVFSINDTQTGSIEIRGATVGKKK